VDNDPLAEVVAATLARRDALREAGDQLNRRRLGLWRMHNEQQKSVGDIANTVRDALLAAGVPADQIKDAGVSYESVSKIVKAPRP